MTDHERRAGRDLDLDTPNPARVYDYLIGGKLNYAMDRVFGDRVLTEIPYARESCLLNRYWLRRAVRFGVAQGIRQFLDVGSGMPTEGHVHEIAQQAAPESRVVYVDNEPIAVAHSELVLEGNDQTAMIMADAERPADIFHHPAAERLLDFSRPMMVILAGLMHYFPDDHNPAAMVAKYRDQLAPGSFLALSALTGERQGEQFFRGMAMFNNSTDPVHLRGGEEIRALLAGVELVEPGIVFTPEWRPDDPSDVGETPNAGACWRRSAANPSVSRAPLAAGWSSTRRPLAKVPRRPRPRAAPRPA